uniref:B box-type domain-containing protein n=1 Tax=Neogobius melanostomus TaxID=47308 RepID=A0A8C6S4F6_9GOBI
ITRSASPSPSPLRRQTVRHRRPAELCADPGDVLCDVCTERKLKAVQTCLKCLVSYCETHLQPHLQVTPLRKHQLVDPSHNLQENVCFEHNEFKRMFCRSDQQLICYICLVETHKGHDTVPAAPERDRRQAQLQAQRDPLLEMIKDEETDLEKLQQEAENICHSAEEAVRHNRESFRKLIRVLKQKRSKIEQQIHTQQQIQLCQVKERQNQLQEDVSEMKRTVYELDELSATPDHNHFLRHSAALSNAMNRAPPPRVQDSGHIRYYGDTNAAVSAIMETVRIALNEGMTNVTLSQVDVLLYPAEPTTKEGFLKYACDITLFTNGGHNVVSLTEDNRRATLKARQGYSENDRECHALSREVLPDRCYWEVQCEGSGVRVVVGKHSGYNSFDGRFWALVRSASSGYTFCSENRTVRIPGPVSDTVGVYLDRQRGILSFYRVAETMAFLHRVQTVFPESLQTGVALLDFSKKLNKVKSLPSLSYTVFLL